MIQKPAGNFVQITIVIVMIECSSQGPVEALLYVVDLVVHNTQSKVLRITTYRNIKTYQLKYRVKEQKNHSTARILAKKGYKCACKCLTDMAGYFTIGWHYRRDTKLMPMISQRMKKKNVWQMILSSFSVRALFEMVKYVHIRCQSTLIFKKIINHGPAYNKWRVLAYTNLGDKGTLKRNIYEWNTVLNNCVGKFCVTHWFTC